VVVDLDSIDEPALRRRRGEKWTRYPADVLPAWVADMDFSPAPAISERLREMVEAGDLGYPLSADAIGVPQAFAERMRKRYGWSIDPAHVEMLVDVVQGIYCAIEVFTERGDGIVTQVPVYPPFLEAIRDTERRRVEAPLVPGPRRYEIDFDCLLANVDARTRILMLSHPQNPTGRAFDRDELAALGKLAVERDWIVLSDEIHSDLVLHGAEHVPFAMLGPEVAERTITLTSATKAFGIAGLRCAVAAFGSESLKRRFDTVHPHLRGGLSSFGLEATLAAWRGGDPWLDAVRGYLSESRDHVMAHAAAHWPRIGVHRPEATYLAWLDCRKLELPADPYHFFLREAQVALADGRRFGPGGEGHVRLNFATTRALLDRILARMTEALERHGRHQDRP
jgi:cysteine-S-conjugate beta-lyase